MRIDDSHKTASVLLFMLGLGSLTQIYFLGCVSLSELVIFVIAPILYLKKYRIFRYMEFSHFINMLIGLIIALMVSSWYNNTAYPFVVKAFASIYSVLTYFIVVSYLLKDNFNGLRWLLIGIFVSSVITIVAFNPTAQVSESGFSYVGETETRDILEGQLFWSDKMRQLLQLVVGGFYYQCPLFISVLSPIIFIAVVVATTVSGRASSVAFIISGVMMLIGRKKRKSMGTIGRYFFLYIFIGISLLFLIKHGYVYAARNGHLGFEAKAKYETQSRKGDDLLTMLMSGRTGFFTAIPAALSRPLVGYGPYAEDVEGYAGRFIMKYGDEQEIASYLISEKKARVVGYMRQIPTHSYIMGAWVHYGLFGLIFYLWILYLLYQHIKKYAAAIPQWYGYLCMLIPYYLWHIFFSPFGQRWQFALFMACIFYARAVGKGLILLPYSMEIQAQKFDAK